MLRTFIAVLAFAAAALSQTVAPTDHASNARMTQSSASENPSAAKPASENSSSPGSYSTEFLTRSSQPTPTLLSAAASSSTTPSPSEDYVAESMLLTLANQTRREAGIPPLRLNQNLAEAARAHAQLMVKWQQLSHQFDGEASLMPRLTQVGLRIDRAGENVAYNSTAEKAFAALMQSPPHRRNLLDPAFDAAGFAAFRSNGRLYVVQDFAHELLHVVATSAK